MRLARTVLVGSTAVDGVRVANCDVNVVKTDNINKPIDIKKSVHFIVNIN